MKTALLAYQYGMGNSGDFAINIGSLDLLYEYYDQMIIISKFTKSDTEFEIDKEYLNKYYKNIEVIEGPFKLDRSNIVGTVSNYISGLVKYPFLLVSASYNKKFKDAEVVFLNGGNLLRCNSMTDYIRLFALIFPLRLAKRNSIKYILLPQSTTSINMLGLKLLDPYLNSANTVYAREQLSKDRLEQYFPKSNIEISLDTAFFIKDREIVKSKYKKKYPHLSIKKNNVCLTLRKEDIGDIGELSLEKRHKINESIEKLINLLIEDKYTVTFVIQSKKDKEFTTHVYNKFSSCTDVNLVEEYDPLILREIYRNSTCLIGMRLHSLILAMSAGTPVIGYFDQKWGHKNPGTLGQYKMPYGFIDQDPDLHSFLVNSFENKEIMLIEIEKTKNKLRSSLQESI